MSEVQTTAIVQGLPYSEDDWLNVAAQMEQIGHTIRRNPIDANIAKMFTDTAAKIRRMTVLIQKHNDAVGAKV